MIIEHTDGRRVEGVEWSDDRFCWYRYEDDVRLEYPYCYNWREVQEKKRVDVTGECDVGGQGHIYHKYTRVLSRNGYTVSKVTRHHLPEDMGNQFINWQSNSLNDFFKQFECQVVIIEKEQP